MEENSEEYNSQDIQKFVKNYSSKIQKYKDFSISEDPIPHLIVPSKKTITLHNSMSYIISNFPKMKINLNKIQHRAKNKLSLYLINQNLRQYNSSPNEKNIMIINDLIHSKETHFTSVFKDYLIYDYMEEFLRGYFNVNDCKEVLPKFYEYYKNYLTFFCKGTFSSFYVNSMMQEYGEFQAEIYYNINYVKKEANKKKGKKENIDEKNHEQSKNNMSGLISFRTFFTKSIEMNIKNDVNSKNKSIIKKEKEKKLELSNIKPLKNDENDNTIFLPENTTVSIDDVITKKSSIMDIIDLMKNKNKKINLSNKKSTKKIELIIINNKKLNSNRNILSRKFIKSFSKTTSNLNDKSIKKIKGIYTKSKKLLSRNKGNNSNTNNKISSSSNFTKYIDILSSRKNIKSNIPKIKALQNELVLSSSRIIKKKKKSINNIPPLNTNNNIYNYPLFSKNNNSGNLKGTSKNKNSNNNNKINLSLKIKNFYHKIKKINNSSSLYPLSTSKNKARKNNSNKKLEKTKSKNQKSNKYIFSKQNLSKQIKTVKGASFSPRSNCTHNKSLSYSTLNNCNININNNIILSNNYFNNRHGHMQRPMNNSSKRIIDKSLMQKNSKRNSNNKPLTSRNIQIDLDKYKTEENILNSIVLQGGSYKIKKAKNMESNIQYTSFRKSNNNRLLINQRNLFKNKKSYKDFNTKKNLTLKDIPVNNKIKSNLNNHNSTNRIKKIPIDEEFNSTNKTYKNLYVKNTNSQKKIIFDYKKK